MPAHVTPFRLPPAPPVLVCRLRAATWLTFLHRTPYWCIADESYFGTLLSSKLMGEVEGELTDDIAMAMLRGGDGIYAQDIDLELVRILSEE